VLKEHNDKWPAKVKVVLGDSDTGVIKAKQAMIDGVEAIISRGGTASLISQEINVPVVEIKVTVSDVLRALSHVPTMEGTVAIMGFPDVISSCKNKLNLFTTSLQLITLNDQSEAKEKILTVAAKGVRVIVGDFSSVEMAVQLGLQGILIESGKEAIRQAITEARLIVGVHNKDQMKGEVLKTVIDSTTDGIV
jgi:hypothetical protein